VVFISGPSSSGKTTFAIRLAIQLRLLGFNPIQISLDNYYRPKDQVPLDEEGKPDLETLDALDLDLFQDNLNALYAGEDVDLPKFSFKGKGERYYEHKPISLKNNTILVIEGIHGLNPRLIPGVDRKTTFKIYISALTQLNLDDHNRISTTDNRILRRIVRDNRTRSTTAQMTLEMWPSVERGETQHIFPYQNEADIMINSALEYELPVLKPYVEPLLKTVKPEAREAYPTARRLLSFLENVYPIPADLVPSDSLLREFIGGSEFHQECH
jgi:uridine kinase